MKTSEWAKCYIPTGRCKIGLGRTLWMSMSGPARAQTWSKLNISGDTWNSCPPTVNLQPDKVSIDCFTLLLCSSWSVWFDDIFHWLWWATVCCSWRKELDSVLTALNVKCGGMLNSWSTEKDWGPWNVEHLDEGTLEVKILKIEQKVLTIWNTQMVELFNLRFWSRCRRSWQSGTHRIRSLGKACL